MAASTEEEDEVWGLIRQLGIGYAIEALADRGISSLSDLAMMTASDLSKLGLQPQHSQSLSIVVQSMAGSLKCVEEGVNGTIMSPPKLSVSSPRSISLSQSSPSMQSIDDDCGLRSTTDEDNSLTDITNIQLEQEIEPDNSPMKPLQSPAQSIKTTKDQTEERGEIETTMTKVGAPPSVECERISVVIRKRPLGRSEESELDVVSCEEGGRVVVSEARSRVDCSREWANLPFRFDKAFGAEDDNCKIYNSTVASIIPEIFDGGNATVFAFGATGSGKTHTLLGPGGGLGSATTTTGVGLYAMAAQDIFLESAAKSTDGTIGVFVSLFEIYDSKLFDLLNERCAVKCLEDCYEKVQVLGLTEERAESEEHLLEIVSAAQLHRSVGSTGANDTSSRSHAVLQITLRKHASEVPSPATTTTRKQRLQPSQTTHRGQRKQAQQQQQQLLHGVAKKAPKGTARARAERQGWEQVGQLSFIDLAGSERGSDTAANSKATRREGAQINTSLLALKEVIRALQRQQQHQQHHQQAEQEGAGGGGRAMFGDGGGGGGHSNSGSAYAPFRGSKLTQVLKESFVGPKCRTVMIACVSPCFDHTPNTLNTLRYADRVKEYDHEEEAVSEGGDELGESSLLGKKSGTTSALLPAFSVGSSGGPAPPPPPPSGRASVLHYAAVDVENTPPNLPVDDVVTSPLKKKAHLKSPTPKKENSTNKTVLSPLFSSPSSKKAHPTTKRKDPTLMPGKFGVVPKEEVQVSEIIHLKKDDSCAKGTADLQEQDDEVEDESSGDEFCPDEEELEILSTIASAESVEMEIAEIAKSRHRYSRQSVDSAALDMQNMLCLAGFGKSTRRQAPQTEKNRNACETRSVDLEGKEDDGGVQEHEEEGVEEDADEEDDDEEWESDERELENLASSPAHRQHRGMRSNPALASRCRDLMLAHKTATHASLSLLKTNMQLNTNVGAATSPNLASSIAFASKMAASLHEEQGNLATLQGELERFRQRRANERKRCEETAVAAAL